MRDWKRWKRPRAAFCSLTIRSRYDGGGLAARRAAASRRFSAFSSLRSSCAVV